MKRTSILLTSILLAVLLCAGLTACGNDEPQVSDEPETYEIALITGQSGIKDKSFNETIWNSISAFCEEQGITCKYYASGEEERDAYLESVEKAIKGGAKLVFFSGGQFETTVFKVQKEYADIDFVILDGVPRDKKYNYEIAGNTVSILFAEEQAGYLAGYAAVTEGYTKLGFMGGTALPPVKRFGYGFVQGAAAASKELATEAIKIKYTYTETFEANDDVLEQAQEWYKDGTEVIFSCGGGIVDSIVKAAEASGGKVIGVDTDQSALSECVITSATKSLGPAVIDVIKNYRHNNFNGGAILNYNADNNGIGLELGNARLNVFTQEQYEAVYKGIEKGDRTIEKELEKQSVKELGGKNAEVEVFGEEDNEEEED